VDVTLRLPTGEELPGSHPVVVIGPNGSGKSRHARTLLRTDGGRIEFVNALRNTRVAPELPAMGQQAARSNFESQKAQAQTQHWELSSEFDYLLSQLLAENAKANDDYVRRVKADPREASSLPVSALSRMEDIWGDVFPSRSLRWDDWRPMVDSAVESGITTSYSGNTMSDGEKAALFLAGRVFSTDPGVVLVVDEPETHFHSLLAIQLWDTLEAARPDLRFVYITHDLTFAMSRSSAQFVLASPTQGFRTLALSGDLPADVAAALLGSASLSFHASRVVFCEGEETSYDKTLYNAWFNGTDTVVRPVGGCERVMRCVEALRESGIINSLEAVGIIDRDYHPDSFLIALPQGIVALETHEIESLLSLPGVVRAIATHVHREFDEAAYVSHIRNTANETERHRLIINRWKRRIEPLLASVIATAGKRDSSLEDLTSELPDLFRSTNWNFDPQQILKEEVDRVDKILTTGSSFELLQILPGKPILPLAARYAGMTTESYVQLVAAGLKGATKELTTLSSGLVAALAPHLPPRAVAPLHGPGSLPLTPE